MLKIKNNKNKVICGKINIKNSLLDYVSYKQFVWYGNMRRIKEEDYLKQYLIDDRV